MAGALVQSKFVHTSATSVSVTLGAAVTSGNTVVLIATLGDSAHAFTTWADDKSNTYTSDYAATGVSNTSTKIEFRRCDAVTNGPITFTVSLDATRDCSLTVQEWSGLAASPVDQTVTGNGTGFSISKTVTTGFDNEAASVLVINTDGVATIPTAGSGWTLDSTNTGSEYYHTETKILGAAGSYTADMSVANNNFLDIYVVTYKVATASAPAKHLRMSLGVW